jgi:cytidine deaminase
VSDAARLGALVAAARAARAHAYAPYSRFAVGAAVELVDGSIITGSNFENASYGLSLCAEAVAIASANAAGRMADILALAVTGGAMDEGVDGAVIMPCGRCRQILAEVQSRVAAPIMVYCAAPVADDVSSFTVEQLLPHAFAPSALAGPGGAVHTTDPSSGNR